LHDTTYFFAGLIARAYNRASVQPPAAAERRPHHFVSRPAKEQYIGSVKVLHRMPM